MIEEGFEDYLEEYTANRQLFQEGDPGDSFFVIKDGLVGIFKEMDGERKQVASLGPGEVLGEMALIGEEQPKPRSASANTLTDVKCWRFSEQQFESLMNSSQKFRNRILTHLSSKIKDTSEKLFESKNKDERLYMLSFIVLKLIEDTTTRLGKNQTLSLKPDIKSIASALELPPRQIKLLLSAPDVNRRDEMSDELREKAVEASDAIIQTLLANTIIQTPYEGEYENTLDQKDFKSLKDVCRAAKQLDESLKSDIDNLTRDRYEAIWDDYDQIKKRYERAKQEPGEDDRLIRRLGTILNSIQEKLQSINTRHFDEESSDTGR